MSHPTASPQIRRLVLVPATSSGRGDELVRRYRLARLKLAGGAVSSDAWTNQRQAASRSGRSPGSS